MRRWTMYLLPFMTACMSGANPIVLSDGGITDYPVGLGGNNGGIEAPQGHAGFALLLNGEREDAGAISVTEDSRLSAAALAHAQDMVTNHYLSHTDLDGGTVGDRVLEYGYDWNFIAENIARGFATNASVIAAWMNSPSHRDNMVDPRAEDFGLGRVNDTWVLLLGREFD